MNEQILSEAQQVFGGTEERFCLGKEVLKKEKKILFESNFCL